MISEYTGVVDSHEIRTVIRVGAEVVSVNFLGLIRRFLGWCFGLELLVLLGQLVLKRLLHGSPVIRELSLQSLQFLL